MYQVEHDELFRAIRNGQTINDGDFMAQSTLMSIMGREAAYGGGMVTYDEALNSKDRLGPTTYDFADLEMPEVPKPTDKDARCMSNPDRRQFLLSSTAMLASSAALAGSVRSMERRAQEQGDPMTDGKRKRDIKKALKYGMIADGDTVLEKFQSAKAAGFEGIEMDSPSNLDIQEVIAARDATGMVIPGVVDSVHWQDTLSDPDPEVRARGVAALETAIRDAKAYGATTVLLVPESSTGR